MTKQVQQELMLSAISVYIARRDSVYFKIKALFDASYNHDVDYTEEVVKLFEEKTNAENCIQSIQEFYAQLTNDETKENDKK